MNQFMISFPEMSQIVEIPPGNVDKPFKTSYIRIQRWMTSKKINGIFLV